MCIQSTPKPVSLASGSCSKMLEKNGSHGFSMVFPWFSYGFSMVSLKNVQVSQLSPVVLFGSMKRTRTPRNWNLALDGSRN